MTYVTNYDIVVSLDRQDSSPASSSLLAEEDALPHMCIFCVLFASRMQLRGIPTLPGPAPRAILLNSPVSLCPLPVTLPGRTNETIFHPRYTTLPSYVSCKSRACHSYENCRGACQQFPFRYSPPITRHLHSSPFHSYRCALFCTHTKLNPFLFNRFRTLCQKPPGWGYGHQRGERESPHMRSE